MALHITDPGRQLSSPTKTSRGYSLGQTKKMFPQCFHDPPSDRTWGEEFGDGGWKMSTLFFFFEAPQRLRPRRNRPLANRLNSNLC